ncbi:MAG: hypothetical protein ACTS40_01925 [Candidatus Hodgkinia cicadicola]
MNSVCWLPRSFLPSKCSRRRLPSRSLNVKSLRRMYLQQLAAKLRFNLASTAAS